MSQIEVLTRRTFLGNLFSAGAFVLVARLLPEEAVGASSPSGAGSTGKAATAGWSPSVYLGVESDGTVIIVTHRSEMGTGIRSVLPRVLADELEEIGRAHV